jgi:hypothetical protein
MAVLFFHAGNSRPLKRVQSWCPADRQPRKFAGRGRILVKENESFLDFSPNAAITLNEI